MSTTREHNTAELAMLRKLHDDTSWLLSEQAGHDLTQTAEGRAAIQ